MSAQFQNENWLKILDAARDMEGAADAPHPVDDDALLNRWSMGLLSADEHQNLIDHLANCSQCRQIVASMLKTDSLQLPEVSEAPVEEDTKPVLLRKQQTARHALSRMVLSLASIILVGVMLYQWSNSGLSMENQIAQLEREMNQGKVQQVYEKSHSLLNKELKPEQRTRIQKLLEQSGIQLAKQALAQEYFADVLQIEQELAQADISSGAMANLKMQAEQGFSQPVLLAQLDRLDRDFGYDFSGYSVTKSLDPFGSEDQTTKRIRQEYEAEIKQHPEAINLKLNFGRFLLENLELDKAIKQFNAVLSLQPDNIPAMMGRGLSTFRRKQYDQAIKDFLAVLQRSPDDLSAKINLAITYQKQNQSEKASLLWKEIEQSTTDDKLKQQINDFLNRK